MNGPESSPDIHHDVSSNTTFGFWVYLMTDSILFATLFATYAVLHKNTFGGPGAKELLSIRYALWETIILLTTSLTAGIAMVQALSHQFKKMASWFGATFLFGFIFLILVGNEFNRLIASGNGWQKNAFLASYFTLIGTHALHIVFGLLFILIFVGQSKKWGLIPITIRRLNCLKIYWFYSYFIWIFMFGIVYLIGAS